MEVDYELVKDNKHAVIDTFLSDIDGAVIITVNGIEIVRLTVGGNIAHICYEVTDRRITTLKNLGFEIVEDPVTGLYGVAYNE